MINSSPVIYSIDSYCGTRDLASSIRDVIKEGTIALAREVTIEPKFLATLGPMIGKPFGPTALPSAKELGLITTIAENGRISSATNWHHDQSFAAVPPDWSLLLCVTPGLNTVPTVFCDAAGLLTFLSEAFIEMLRSLNAPHVAYYPEEGQDADSGVACATHPLIVSVEGSVEALFAAPATVGRISGWSENESQYILGPLFQMLNWPELTVAHSWKSGDLLAWPNRRYPHRVLPFTSGSARHLSRMVGHW